MNLSEFVAYARDFIYDWIDICKNIQPFSDYPFISLWNFIISVLIVVLALVLIPGITTEEIDKAIDDYNSNPDDDSDDFDPFDW